MHRYPSENSGKTPLLCAAEAGHDEIVAYLLGFEEVQADLKKQQEKVNNASVSKSMQWAAREKVYNCWNWEELTASASNNNPYCVCFPGFARQHFRVGVSLVFRFLESAQMVLQIHLSKSNYSDVLSTLVHKTSMKRPTILHLQVCLNRLWCLCAVICLFRNCTACWCQLKCSDWQTGSNKLKQEHSYIDRSDWCFSMWLNVLFLIPSKYFTWTTIQSYTLFLWSFILMHC